MQYVGVDAAQSKVGPPCCFQMIAFKDVSGSAEAACSISLSLECLQLSVIT